MIEWKQELMTETLSTYFYKAATPFPIQSWSQMLTNVISEQVL